MNTYHMRFYFLLALILFVTACGEQAPPLDKNDKSPDTVLLETYQLILDGKLIEAKATFDPRLLQAVLPPTNPDTFESFYQKQTAGWQRELLKTAVVGNDYSDAVWRVRIWNDDGTGSAGAKQDLAIIDGEWRIVFWGDFPKR